MPRIEPVEVSSATPDEARRLAWVEEHFGHATNMKRTLARSDTALRALLEWYPLERAVAPVLGERLTQVFCHAISTQSDCLLCSTYFRRELIDAGEDPDALVLDERARDIVDFGRRIAADSNSIDDALFGRLASWLTQRQLVDLTAFGALMVATNIVNSALRIPLDVDLEAYRRQESAEVVTPG